MFHEVPAKMNSIVSLIHRIAKYTIAKYTRYASRYINT
jgi:hypothetical protein